MKFDEVKEKVLTYLESYLKDQSLRKQESNINLFATGQIDSFGLFELGMFLETEFKISLSDEEISSEALKSIENICNTVITKMG